MIKLNIFKFLTLTGAIALFFAGCGQAPQPPKQRPLIIKTTKEQKHIINVYQMDENYKKALVILIKKQQKLENDVNLLKLKVRDLENLKCYEASSKNINRNKGDKKISYCSSFDLKKSYVSKKDVNIRACPNYYSRILGIVKKGEEVKFKMCNKYCWCLLKDGRGFVSFKLFEPKKTIKEEKKIKKIVKVKHLKNKNVTKKTIKKDKIGETPDEIIKNYINSSNNK